MAGPIRLNIGSGDQKHEGFISVDKYDKAADVQADVCDLPYGDGSVDEITMFQVIEHIPFRLEAQMFAELSRVLKPGGALLTECPDMEYIAGMILADGDIEEKWIWNIYGQVYRPWDQSRYEDWEDNANSRHENAFTYPKCERLAREYGFTIYKNDKKFSDYPECLSLTWIKRKS